MDTKPKWVVFDIGGVIFDYRNALRDVSRHLSVEEDQLSKRLFKNIEQGELGKITFEEAWEEVLHSFRLHHEHANVIRIWWEVKRYVSDTRLLIQELHTAHYCLALFTNNWVGMMDKGLSDISEFSLFDKRIESSLERMRKPNIDFYHLVEKTLSASGEEIYFIDDSKENLVTAKEMHWQTFLYTLGDDNGKSSNDLIRKQLL